MTISLQQPALFHDERLHIRIAVHAARGQQLQPPRNPCLTGNGAGDDQIDRLNSRPHAAGFADDDVAFCLNVAVYLTVDAQRT